MKMSLRKRVILIIFGLFLSVILLEAGLRIAGFLILSAQEYRNKISLERKEAFRILCLGGSTTAGGEAPWPSQLQEIINQKDIGIKSSVINKGRAGMNSLHILSELENYLAEYNPDMVMVMMGINDIFTMLGHINMPAGRAATWFRSFKFSRR